MQEEKKLQNKENSRWLNNLFIKGKHFYQQAKTKTRQSIKLEILFCVAASLILSAFSGLLVQAVMRHTDLGRRKYVTYDESRASFENNIISMLTQLSELEEPLEAEDSSQKFGEVKAEQIKSVLDQLEARLYNSLDVSYYLADGKGEILFQKDYVQSIDLIKIIQKVNNRETIYKKNMFSGIYPIIINDEVCYLFVEAALEGHTGYSYTPLPTFLGLITATGVFITALFKFVKKKIDYIEYLSHCLGEISKGDLTYQVEIIGEDELAKVAKDITYMESEIKQQTEAKLRIEKLKNELISNVAHDLRTPLTSIIGYIGLIKNRQYKNQEEADKYVDIAYSKSEHLKGLIEDLFELTKLHQEGLKLSPQAVSITNLIQQLAEELSPLADEKEVSMKINLQVKNPTLVADVPKITRVFENLMENAIKYSPEAGSVYIELTELKEDFFFAVSNQCENISEEEIERLFDRFYRTDRSRNSLAGGSGLGLAIAKDITVLHGGVIKAKLQGEFISFMLKLPKSIREA